MLWTLFNPTVIAEWVAFVAALCLLPRRVGVWRLFILLLMLTIVAETAGWEISYKHNKNNAWVFNVLMLATNLVWILILRRAEPMAKAAKPLQWILAGFLFFGVGNMLFFQGIWTYNSYTDVLGDVMMAVTCCYFFLACLREEQLRNLFRYEYFWLANGMLFSSLGSVVLYIFIKSLYAYWQHTGVNIYGYVNYGLNIILNGSLIIAFICRNRNTRSSPG
jgi:hypothetical protein